MNRRTINLYFMRLYISNVVAIFAMVLALVYLVDLIELSRRGRFDGIDFATVAAISAYRVPAFLEQAFPFIVLFASIFTLVSLNRKMELVVARAAGISIWQILLPFLAGSLLLGVFATAVYSPLATVAQNWSADLETQFAGDRADDNANRTPWLRQSGNGVNSIIGAKAVSAGGSELGGVTAFVLNDNGIASERIDAPNATLGRGMWVLHQPVVTRVGFSPEQRASYSIPTTLLPEYIEQRLANPETISIWELPGKIEAARSLGYNADAFSMRLFTLLAKPALFMAMTLVAATVAVQYSRTGQSTATIIGGVAAGFVLYVATFLAQALGSSSVVPPAAAAWFPAMAAGLFGVTVLLHQEDG
ncbi:LPS export ABC transporter permease LptG [Aureimonas fodinaquatilis]|uniref:LPS export ABC transporter permease LptG n=1 Tax=Aureimonas fodinaquatilis TaxID=2565783 RepID=A0A5B0DUT8_9HYPH|nr:LPS export ABC transporter permease LptG [Aureimonas fodinaquatilis]KAA0970216.1 LPS export ABC transporter permease LptG [Aureimonas fodinaquatilis]